MNQLLTQFASSEAASGGVFGALGIDWMMLALQGIAFLILVFLLGKFIYPVFIKTIDERQEKIEAGAQAAAEAEKQAGDAKAEVAKLLKEARREAGEIVATAKDEANAMIEKSEQKAKTRADKIVADAREELEKDVIAAKKALHNETIDLVAAATEKVVSSTVTGKVNDKIITEAVKGAK